MIGVIGLTMAAGAGALSARWNWWRASVPGIPTLMYHKVGNPPLGSQLKKLWVSEEKFRRQMAHLSKAGYQPVTFKDVYAHWDDKVSLPKRPVLITFDDGYANNFDNAFRVLNDFGFRATVFVVTNRIGEENLWHDPKTETRIPMLTWSQVEALEKAGWEIGSHTCDHLNLNKIDRDRAAEQIRQSRARLAQRLVTPPETFAYPYGAGEDEAEIRDLVKAAGYRMAVGIHAGKWSIERMMAEPFHLPRIFVRGDENLVDFRLQLSRGRSRL